MLAIAAPAFSEMVAHCLDGFPLEACGLLVGAPADATGDASAMTRVSLCLPAVNVAASARVYTVAPRDLLRAGRRAEEMGAELVGVYHSHTHTEAFPSPTDVEQAPDPSWHYVLISLRDSEPTVRSYRIRDGRIVEEQVALE